MHVAGFQLKEGIRLARNTEKQVKYKKIARQRRRLQLLRSTIISLLIIASVILIVWLCQIRSITIVGNEKYNAEMIEEDIINGKLAKNTIYHRIRDLFGKKEDISYLTSYKIDYRGLDAITISVTEKQPVAYCAKNGVYILFDSEGLVLETSAVAPENISCVEGLEVDNVVLFDTLPAKDDGLYMMLKNLVGQLEKNDLNPNRILINEKEEMELIFNEVHVKLGTDNALENKIARLIAMLPTLEGKSGILYMENVDENTDKISFIKTN